MNPLIARRWQHFCWRLLMQWPLQLAWVRCAVMLWAVVLGLLGGCASLPPPGARVPSAALMAQDGTALADIAAVALASAPAGQSGLRLLPSGPAALEARLALIEAAGQSIDAQYFLLADDRSGRQFAQALCAAAARGVRVRLLVDDLYAAGSEGLLAALAAQPGVQLRLFNPLPVRSGSIGIRVLGSLIELQRINRRMHNKLLLVDGSFAIAGGRNIADAYFERTGEPAHFIDMDVLLAGPAVRELGAVFDRFWNSPLAWPQAELAADAPDALQPVGSASVADGAPALGDNTLATELARGHVELEPATVEVVADGAELPVPAVASEETELAPQAVVMRTKLRLLRSAREQLLMVSPYVVPMAGLLDAIAAAKHSGARVALLTNSLATTDEPLAHFGYARHRQALLQLGVDLYELMPPPAATIPGSGNAAWPGSLGRLHAKFTVVDRRRFIIGSMNLDRRSAGSNTELGLVVDSPRVAAELADRTQREQLPASYAVQPTEDRLRLQWISKRDGSVWRSALEPGDLGWVEWLRWTMLGLLVADDYL
jgi:putative cardiolipin synthase